MELTRSKVNTLVGGCGALEPCRVVPQRCFTSSGRSREQQSISHFNPIKMKSSKRNILFREPRWKTDFEKGAVVTNFERRGWARCHDDDWNLYWANVHNVKVKLSRIVIKTSYVDA